MKICICVVCWAVGTGDSGGGSVVVATAVTVVLSSGVPVVRHHASMLA